MLVLKLDRSQQPNHLGGLGMRNIVDITAVSWTTLATIATGCIFLLLGHISGAVFLGVGMFSLQVDLKK